MIYQLFYTSEATSVEAAQSVIEQLPHFRSNNKKLGLTGILLHVERANGSLFIQILEGSEEAVKGIVEVIRKDNRHENFDILHQEFWIERQFENWSMGLKSVTEKTKGKADFEFERATEVISENNSFRLAIEAIERFYL